MNYIIHKDKENEAHILHIGQLYEALKEVEDNRQARGKRYCIGLLLMVVILAKLCGEDTPYGIAEWAAMRKQALQHYFGYHRYVQPSHNTIRRLMAVYVNDENLQMKLREYLHQTYGGQQSLLIVIDGKTLRGTIPKGKKQGVHLLAAYLPAEGVVLLQIEVAQKENEIVAAPKLLTRLDLKGRVVSGDAMFTQRDISVAVLAAGGDYIWLVKENQPTLHDDIERFFMPTQHAAGWNIPPLPQEVARETVKQAGRLETRYLTAIPDEHDYLQWPGAATVFQLSRRVTRISTGETYSQLVYGLTSLAYAPGCAHKLLQWTRQHWGIENGLHYRRDVTLKEDATRMSHSHQAQVLATLNNLVVALAHYLGFTNLASARRFCQAKLDAALFSIPT